MLNSSNLLNLDYRKESEKFQRLPHGIVDVHTHIHGVQAGELYREAANLYGVTHTFSMTRLREVSDVKSVLQDRVSFICVPEWQAEDKKKAFLSYHDQIDEFAAHGAKVCKFWAAPRARDLEEALGLPGFLRLDSDHVLRSAEKATKLGMLLMVHISDPDTWFRARYPEQKYGSKAEQYQQLTTLLNAVPGPCIAAHMGGFPEDLGFLDSLLSKHSQLYLDMSATKWMVRELSKHPRGELIGFLRQYRGRILFGSDIVTSDDHLHEGVSEHPMNQKATSVEEAFDLYASRYWALRTLLETDYKGPSPIADPDLSMIDPDSYTDRDSPVLEGKRLEAVDLEWLYYRAAQSLFSQVGITV